MDKSDIVRIIFGIIWIFSGLSILYWVSDAPSVFQGFTETEHIGDAIIPAYREFIITVVIQFPAILSASFFVIIPASIIPEIQQIIIAVNKSLLITLYLIILKFILSPITEASQEQVSIPSFPL